MPTKPPSRSKMAEKLSKPGSLTKPAKEQHVAKTFSVAPLTGAGEGEKILIYAQSGTGKTTLAAQVPDNVFIPLDDGARKIANAMTGKPVNAITGVESWEDLRDAVNQARTLVPAGGTLTVDTITRAQPLAEDWVVRNVNLEKGGRAKNLEAFGFGKGYRHVLDQIRCLLSDFDRLIRSGRNVILLAQLDQCVVANPSGLDYYCEVPKLIENKQGPVRTEVCEWCDQIMRIGYLNTEVEKDNEKSRAGKATGDSSRAVFTEGAQYYVAKSRPIKGERVPPLVSFETEADNSVWQFVFPA